MQNKPLSLLHAIAEHYLRDAQDFAARFDVLWETQLHKTGRIKSFIDLTMSCECALKSHVALGRINDDARDVYLDIRSASHQIATLASAAQLMTDRTNYDQLATRLQDFRVELRYSLDSYGAFFPSYTDRLYAKLNYSKTIGNNAWVLETRALLTPLLTCANDAVSGFVTDDDIDAIFEQERQMKELIKGNSKKQASK